MREVAELIGKISEDDVRVYAGKKNGAETGTADETGTPAIPVKINRLPIVVAYLLGGSCEQEFYINHLVDPQRYLVVHKKGTSEGYLNEHRYRYGYGPYPYFAESICDYVIADEHACGMVFINPRRIVFVPWERIMFMERR
ncbi:hypothetical protein [uncultured Chloroflexus sp.]|uniref:hypothetical protein n=1 Tax=uncultured Chloroflexus sp. TaxID=214040 RepID=UPI00262D1948|nr:hypothetical protein [uncultured Chloroflexus sp.]